MPLPPPLRAALAAAGIVAALSPAAAPAQERACPHPVTVRWDGYGVPHVSAPDEEALFYAFGWAQMKSHANLVLQLYGSARGRAAEYWGAERVGDDATIHTLDVPEQAARALALQPPAFRRRLERFVDGMNDYAAAHPEAVKPENRAVLPVAATDLFAHLVRALEMGFVGRSVFNGGLVSVPLGSNALALAPGQTASGNAMLLANPHLPWQGFFTLYEAHLEVGGRDVYGATLVGLPVLVIAFNRDLGWTHTANYVDGADIYEVEMADSAHYRFGGATRALERKAVTLRVRGADGAMQTRELRLPRTVHGPVLLQRGGKAYAYRSTRGMYPLLFEQYWKMARARGRDEFVRALRMMQLPYFNVVYADRAGHVMYMWNGLLPERASGDAAFWSRPVPGGDPALLWTRTYGFDRLPKVQASTGWVQNTNDLPWTATLAAPLRAGDFPRVIPAAEVPGLRTQQLLRTLSAGVRPSFETLREMKFENRVEMADRVLDDLPAAIRDARVQGDDRAILDEAGRVLAAWDRRVDAESRGAVLFRAWIGRLGEQVFARGFDPDSLLSTPRGLGNPGEAALALLESAKAVRARHGALDVKWGDVFRLRAGGVEVPASGGPDFLGIFHSIAFTEDEGKFYARGGESYSAIVEFSDPVRAEVLLSYGNSSQEGSPHRGDQLSLVAAHAMRPALLDRAQIERAATARDLLSTGNGACQ